MFKKLRNLWKLAGSDDLSNGDIELLADLIQDEKRESAFLGEMTEEEWFQYEKDRETGWDLYREKLTRILGGMKD